MQAPSQFLSMFIALDYSVFLGDKSGLHVSIRM